MSRFETQPIRVLLIDDHDVVRLALRIVIEARPNLQLVAEARNPEEAIDMAGATNPDIILLDIDLNGEDGISLLPALFAAAHKARIVLITGDRKADTHRRAVKLGAKGVVLKDQAIATVTHAIERVHGGKLWLDDSLIAGMIDDLSRPAGEGSYLPAESLTARERTVVELLCKGLKNQQIAAQLAISEATVRHHLTSIFGKLGVNTRARLIVYAYENGLLPPPK